VIFARKGLLKSAELILRLQISGPGRSVAVQRSSIDPGPGVSGKTRPPALGVRDFDRRLPGRGSWELMAARKTTS
jgi:hypothetical protein